MLCVIKCVTVSWAAEGFFIIVDCNNILNKSYSYRLNVLYTVTALVTVWSWSCCKCLKCLFWVTTPWRWMLLCWMSVSPLKRVNLALFPAQRRARTRCWRARSPQLCARRRSPAPERRPAWTCRDQTCGNGSTRLARKWSSPRPDGKTDSLMLEERIIGLLYTIYLGIRMGVYNKTMRKNIKYKRWNKKQR